MSLARMRKNKLLIGTVAGVSLGIISFILWNRSSDENKEKEKEKEIKWSDLTETKIDDRQPVPVRTNRLPDDCKYISQSELKDLVLSSSSSDSECLIIDVRDAMADYSGGHVVNSINISDKTFYGQIPDIVKKYNMRNKIIIYCMYGARRSIKCIEYYSKAIQEIIANYSADTQSSFYFMYSLKAQSKMSIDPNESMIGMLYGRDYEWIEQNVEKKKIEINFCNDELIENLSKQKKFVLKDGYHTFMNESIADVENSSVIQDFDETKWEQLELTGVYDKKMWYHTNEYFAKAKFQELKQAKKSQNFKLNSSNTQI